MTSVSHEEPKAPTAHDILFGSHEAYRRDQDKDTRTVGTRVLLIHRSEKTLAFLREIGNPEGKVPVKRMLETLKTRQPYLRRANPRRPEQVDEAIVELLRRAVVDGCESLMIRREGVAAWLKVPEHSVSQSLERLNKQGLVGPEENHAPHDNNRGHGWGGSESGWCGSIRYARMDRLRSLFDIEAPVPTKRPRPR